MYPFMSNVTTNANNPIYVELLKEATVSTKQQALKGYLVEIYLQRIASKCQCL